MNTSSKKGTALVTGTSSGIGAAFAERLAVEGFDLVLVARRGDRLQALASRLRERTQAVVSTLAADLTVPGDLQRVEERVEKDPTLTLLVNNAGRGDILPFVDMPRDLVENMIALNVTALTRLTHAALPGMLGRGGGTVINVSSGLAYGVFPPFAVYGATKAYVSHFTELLHEEYGARGIRFQALVPGLTRTNLGGAEEKKFFDQFPKEMVMSPEDLVDASMAGLSLGEVCCFPLLADAATWARARAAFREVGHLPPTAQVAARYRAGRT